MAPMEPAKAEEALAREALEQALADHSVEQLREMGKRLTKSHDDLKEMLGDLEAEGLMLREESEYLNSTINLMMKELHKLNIGAGNTVEPQLDEGPLDFVGRFWEKMKPRDTAYQTSEHVGEIRKPVVVDGPTQPPTAQELAQHASQQVVQTAQRIQTALGPLWQRTQGFISEKQHEIAGAVAARAKQRPQRGSKEQPSQPQQRSGGGKRQSGGYPDGSTSAGKAAEGSGAAASSSAGPAVAGGAVEECAAAPPPAAAEAPLAVPEGDKAEGESANGAAAEAGPAAAAAGAEEQTSTILIEAQLKVDDGSVLTLHVRAADRCKEVAQRFVQEHSLKAWFQEPLTAWLKKVEADAVKFPVKIEADLAEIRKQYSKSK